MPNQEVLNLLPQYIIYLVLGAFIFGFVLKQVAEISETFAKLLGPLGRWLRRKIDQEHKDRLEVFKQEAREAVDTELGVTRKAEYAELKKQLVNVLDRVQEMERNEALYEAYLVSDATWHREINIRLAERGVLDPPLPERLPFSEFEANYRREHGWDTKQRP